MFIDCLGIFGAWLLVERGRYRKGGSSRFGWLFDRRWAMLIAGVLWVTLLFAMSLFPFGLVTLGAPSGDLPKP